MDFPGVALVTGAASGIGRATALQYASDGCKRIVISDIDVLGLAAVEEELQHQSNDLRVKSVQVDVRDQASIERMVQSAVDTFGRIDYCANVAGILRYGDTSVLPVEDFELVYQINLRGIFLSTKAEINQMLQQQPLTSRHCTLQDSPFPSRGVICNVSSEAGLMGNGNLPAYVATKHGVIGLSKSDGVKFAAQGIRVNALCPGTIETPILGALPQGEEGARRAKERVQDIAMARVGQPSEIAQCVIFLTSGRSSFVTATTLSAHGGLRNR
ncbi:hypothetical protein BDV06DRAFT_215625 [Aspergillus oleicola]